MKSILSKFIQTGFVISALVLTVSMASAWTGPSGTFPAGNVTAPLNTGAVDQTKAGNLGTLKSFIAGDSIGAGNLMMGNKAAFGCLGTTCWNANYAATNTDKFKAGTFNAGSFLKGLFVSSDGLVSTKNSPLWINLSGNTGSTGRNGLAIFPSTDNLNGGAGAVLQTSADKFSLWNMAGTAKVGISAGSVDTNGLRVAAAGTAQPGKVLTAMNTAGDAIWADAAQQGAAVSVPSIGNIVVNRRTFKNDGNTLIHDAYATCDPGYVAISGGVDCESSGGQGKHDVSISEPSQGAASYPYGSGTGNTTSSTNMPTGWHGACTDRLSNNSSLDMHVTVVCMKLVSVASATSNSNTGGSPNTGGSTWTPATAWHPVPNTITNSTTAGETCKAWLTGNSSIPSTFVVSNSSDYGYKWIASDGTIVMGGNPDPISGCVYKAVTANNATYCTSGSPDANPGTLGGVSGFKPAKTCTGFIRTNVWSQTNDSTLSAFIKY